MTFDSKETEEYYYSKLKELRIGHISVNSNKIYTIHDVDEIIKSLEIIISSN